MYLSELVQVLFQVQSELWTRWTLGCGTLFGKVFICGAVGKLCLEYGINCWQHLEVQQHLGINPSLLTSQRIWKCYERCERSCHERPNQMGVFVDDPEKECKVVTKQESAI